MPELSIELFEAKHRPHLIKTFCDSMYQKESDSFFLSYFWFDAWLQSLPESVSPQILLISETPFNAQNDSGSVHIPDLAALVGIQQRKIIGYSLSEAYINETGDEAFDDVVIERNGFLEKTTGSRTALPVDKLFSFLKVNRLCINNMKHERLTKLLSRLELGRSRYFVSSRPSYYVALEKVRNADGGYASLISANKRRQIKRSLSLYEQQCGPVYLEEPDSLSKACDIFDKMVALHQREWNARGKEGTFANPFILSMHKKLLSSCFDKGKVRIFRVYGPQKTLGVIYGFVSSREFLYYQSGFLYGKDNRLKPGLLCHKLVIDKLAQEGFDVYDFLAGDAQYKKSLGTDAYRMSSLELYDNSYKSQLFLLTRFLGRRLKRFISIR